MRRWTPVAGERFVVCTLTGKRKDLERTTRWLLVLIAVLLVLMLASMKVLGVTVERCPPCVEVCQGARVEYDVLGTGIVRIACPDSVFTDSFEDMTP